jgi:hypothetical protein
LKLLSLKRLLASFRYVRSCFLCTGATFSTASNRLAVCCAG